MKNFYFLLILIGFLCSCKDKSILYTKKLENAFYKAAINYRDSLKNTDSSFLYFNKAKDLFLLQKDSLGAGKCLINMAIISTDQGDNYGGQELSLSAISYFNPKDSVHQIYIKSNLNNLGISSANLRMYYKAIEFYKQSLAYTTDSTNISVIENNIAYAYQNKGDYSEALSIYDRILKNEHHLINYARILTNLANTKWLLNSYYNPVPVYLKALAVRKQEQDFWGQNSSYSYLVDFYKKSNSDSALYYAAKMYQAANIIQSPDDRLKALKELIKLSPAIASKNYFVTYQQLDDSLQIARNAAKNQFAMIRYETEKHKADNLKLQKENTERQIWLIGLVIFILFGTIFTITYYKKRKEHLELEAEKAIKESQLKTSKKVHDVVANGLYRLMSEIENKTKINQNNLLDEMEILYEQSRNISYDDENLNQTAKYFQSSIAKLCRNFESVNTKVIILGNDINIWERLSPLALEELKLVLQELMINMKKHSEASHVAIRFEELRNTIKIYYTDNGKGMPSEVVFGNGLHNTGNRIKGIGGTIKFVEGLEVGFKVQILIPLAPLNDV